jgi:AraC-like DNA-binding protein
MTHLSEIISYGHIENKLMYPHRNPGMEIVLVDHGHLEWAVEQVPEVLNPGSVFFTLPWQTHGSLQLREPPNKIFYILFSLPGSVDPESKKIQFPAALKFCATVQIILGHLFKTGSHHAWQASPLLRQLFPELIHRLDGSGKLDGLAVVSLLRSILIELADIISKAESAQQKLSPTVTKVRTFLGDLGKSLDHPWTLEEMAECCGVKRTQFSNIIKGLTGYPPTQYLNRVRFEKACDLLRNTARPITDIAFDCGYGSSQYFSETFKKYARMTPSEYRSFIPELDAVMQNNWDHPEWRTIAEEQKRAAVFEKKD